MIKYFEKLSSLSKSFINSLVAIFKIIVMSKLTVKLPEQKGDSIAFFANGPSLNNALIKLREQNELPDNIMVSNFFCLTDLFDELRPNHYVVCDPLFKRVGYDSNEKVKKFYEKLYSIDWGLNFFVPFGFKKDIEAILKENNLVNDKVKIYYYNSVNFNGTNSFLLLLMKKGLGMPRPTTVAVPGVFNCMSIGYKDVKIAGIDLNQHLDIVVSKENVLSLKVKHFYNKGEVAEVVPWVKNSAKETFKVSEIFLIFHHFFYSFDVLAQYANKYKVTITNYSEESYLDQFKKI